MTLRLREMVEDKEDYFLAANVLERVRKGQEAIHSSAEVRAELGLADTGASESKGSASAATAKFNR